MSKRKSFSPKVVENLRTRILEERLFQAIYTRHLPDIMNYIHKGVNLNYVSLQYGSAAIHILAGRNDYVLGYRLMQTPGINLDLKTKHGHSAMHLACLFNYKKFVQMLLQMGADPNITDNKGQTPLHYAVKNGSFSIIYYLLKNKANVNVMDSFENTPLSVSLVDQPNLLIAKLLCAENIDWSLEDKKSSLHIYFEVILACHTLDQIELVMVLLDNGIDVNMIDKLTNRICLHFISMTGHLDLAIVLVQKGANLDAVDCLGRTPAKLAAELGNEGVADYFRKGYRVGNPMLVIPLLKNWVRKYRQSKTERQLREELEQRQMEEKAKEKKKGK